jgi:hypothetical protein
MGWRPLGRAHLVCGDLNRPFLIDGSGALWAEQNDDLEQTLTQFSPPSPDFCGMTQERESERRSTGERCELVRREGGGTGGPI